MYVSYLSMYISKVSKVQKFLKKRYFASIELEKNHQFSSFGFRVSGYGSSCITLKSVTTTLFQVPESVTKIREKKN